MALDQLKIVAQPKLSNATMVLGFSGWMDGGDVSTGTIEYLVDSFNAQILAQIAPEQFYIYNFPGSMEVSSLFRPHLKIEGGLVTEFKPPANTFYYEQANNLVLFEGKEPNFNWSQFADCMFAVATAADVSAIYFAGSVGGMAPHTREPRLFSSVSHARIKCTLEAHGLNFTNYEGPGSFISYLMTLADQRGFEMATIVAEIPPYVQGRNFKCIEAVVRKLSAITATTINMGDLRVLGDELESRITELVEKRPELAEQIRKLEEDYDNDIFDTQMGDLKIWLEEKGIRLE